MKKILIILFLLINISLNATIYYVQPVSENANASDSNAGTDIDYPWATWGKAFNATEVQPGDTVYFRGGVYNKNIAEGNGGWYYPSRSQEGTGYNISRDGTADNYIHYFAYPPDYAVGNKPILDCYDAYSPTNRLVWGIYAGEVNYVHFKGLTVRNVRQIEGRDMAAFGWQVRGRGLIFEQCEAYNIWGVGFRCGSNTGYDIHFINCDAWMCCDSLSAAQPGNDGYGFQVIESSGNDYYTGCRAWLCGDDGFSASILFSAHQTHYLNYNNCWSFRNGMLEGGGSGFKMGWIAYTDGNLKRTYKNCIAAYNRWNGWKTNDYRESVAIYCHVYNCVAYHNGWQGGVGFVSGGFEIHNVSSDTDENELKRILRNNISYDNEGNAVWLGDGALYTHDHNSWDIPITLTDNDFVSLDSTGLTGARQADGSLPVLNFLKLSSTSAAIDAGTDVGLDYNNAAPDLGAYEYPTFDEAVVPARSFVMKNKKVVKLNGKIVIF